MVLCHCCQWDDGFWSCHFWRSYFFCCQDWLELRLVHSDAAYRVFTLRRESGALFVHNRTLLIKKVVFLRDCQWLFCTRYQTHCVLAFKHLIEIFGKWFLTWLERWGFAVRVQSTIGKLALLLRNFFTQWRSITAFIENLRLGLWMHVSRSMLDQLFKIFDLLGLIFCHLHHVLA